MRRILYGISATLALISLSLIIYTLLFSPRLIVTAPTDTSITVYPAEGSTQIRSLTTTSTTTTLHLKTGTYKVLLKSGTAQERFYTSTSAFHKATYRFEPTKTLSVQRIAQQVAYNTIPDGSGGVIYLDTTKHLLEDIDSTGVHTVINSSRANGTVPTSTAGGVLSAPHIISGNRAIVIVNSKLYLLSQKSLTPINMTGLPSDFTSLTIGTNPLQESFIVAANNTLYEYSSPAAVPQEITNLSNSADILVLGGNEAVAYATRMPNTSVDKSTYIGFAIDPIVINLSDRSQHILTQGPVTSVSVSPNGQYATVEPLSANLMTLYDLKNNKPIYSTDSSDIITPIWTDTSHFLYAQYAGIWRENITTRVATLLTSIPNETELTSITFSPLNNIYFATTYMGEDNASMYQIQGNRKDQ